MSLFARVPRARSSHESHIPDRVITVHQTRSTTAHSYPIFPSKHTDTDVRNTTAGQNKLWFTLSFSLQLSHIHSIFYTQTKTDKKQTLSHTQTPFSLSMKECQKEFPDTSQMAKQWPMWAKVANQKSIITKSELVTTKHNRLKHVRMIFSTFFNRRTRILRPVSALQAV